MKTKVKLQSAVIALALFSMGCGLLPNSQVNERQLKIQRLWVRSTLPEDTLTSRRVNRMTPLRVGNLVIAANAFDNIAAYQVESGDVVWKKTILGGVEAGAQLYKDKLFFGANDGQFYCLDAGTGRVLWTFPTRTETLTMPLIADGVIYFLTGTNILYALDLESGKKLWIYSRQDSQQLSIRGGSDPIIQGDRIILGFSDGVVVALNNKTGNLVWEKQINHNKKFRDVDSRAVVDGERVYISGFDDSLYCLNTQDGREIWRVQVGGFAAVTISQDFIYYPTSNGQLLALDRASGKKIWEIKTAGIATKPVLYKGFLIFGEAAGKLQFVDALTGKKVVGFEPGRGLFSTPLVEETTGKIFFMSNEANLYSLQLNWVAKAEILPWEKE